MTLSLMLGQLEAHAQHAGDATTYTQQTFYDWFNKYKDAKPESNLAIR